MSEAPTPGDRRAARGPSAVARQSLLLVYALALLSPNIVAWTRSPTGLEEALALLVATFLFAAWHVAWSWRRIAVALMLPFFLLLPFDLYLVSTYRQDPSPHTLAIAVQTPAREVLDFLAPRWAALLGALLLSLCVWGAALWAAPFGHDRGHDRPRLRRAAAAMCLAFGAWAGAASIPLADRYWRDRVASTHDFPIALGSSFLGFGLMKGVAPWGRIATLVEYWHEERGLRELVRRRADAALGATRPVEPPDREIYVLVVGESARRDRWALYQAERPTNPRLARQEGLIVLRDVVTPWSFTLGAVPVMLTSKSGQDRRRYFEVKSLISAFREVGFDTYWISAQGAAGHWDAPVRLIAMEAHRQVYVHGAVNFRRGLALYDEALLPPLAQAIASPSRRKLIVLHVLGSHEYAWERYPESFDRFLPTVDRGASELRFGDRAFHQKYLNSYDNSVLYQDFLLARVIDLLHGSGAVAALVFAADHGQEVFQGTCGLHGPGHLTRGVFEVPAFVWVSDEYAARFPAAVARLRASAELPYTLSVIPRTLMDMALVRARAFDEGESLLREGSSPSRRIVNAPGPRVWETLRFSGPCEVVETQ